MNIFLPHTLVYTIIYKILLFFFILTSILFYIGDSFEVRLRNISERLEKVREKRKQRVMLKVVHGSAKLKSKLSQRKLKRQGSVLHHHDEQSPATSPNGSGNTKILRHVNSTMLHQASGEGELFKRRRSNEAVIIVSILDVSSFLSVCLLCKHSFSTNPNRVY